MAEKVKIAKIPYLFPAFVRKYLNFEVSYNSWHFHSEPFDRAYESLLQNSHS